MTIYFKVEPVFPEAGIALPPQSLQEMSLACAQMFEREEHGVAFAKTSADVFSMPFVVVRVYERQLGTYRPGGNYGSVLARSSGGDIGQDVVTSDDNTGVGADVPG